MDEVLRSAIVRTNDDANTALEFLEHLTSFKEESDAAHLVLAQECVVKTEELERRRGTQLNRERRFETHEQEVLAEEERTIRAKEQLSKDRFEFELLCNERTSQLDKREERIKRSEEEIEIAAQEREAIVKEREVAVKRREDCAKGKEADLVKEQMRLLSLTEKADKEKNNALSARQRELDGREAMVKDLESKVHKEQQRVANREGVCDKREKEIEDEKALLNLREEDLKARQQKVERQFSEVALKASDLQEQEMRLQKAADSMVRTPFSSSSIGEMSDWQSVDDYISSKEATGATSRLGQFQRLISCLSKQNAMVMRITPVVQVEIGSRDKSGLVSPFTKAVGNDEEDGIGKVTKLIGQEARKRQQLGLSRASSVASLRHAGEAGNAGLDSVYSAF